MPAKNILSVILSLLLLASPMAHADQTEQLAECEALLDSADVVIDKQAETITELDVQNGRLSKALDFQVSETARLTEQNTAWYREPQFVGSTALLVGFLAGVLVNRGH